MAEDVFKGSKVNRQFSLGNLEKTLQENQQQVLREENKVGQRSGVFNQNYHGEWHINPTSIPDRATNEVAKEIGKVVSVLMKPELNTDQPPSELLKESQRKRKKTVPIPAERITSLAILKSEL